MKFSKEDTYRVNLHHRDLGGLGEATLTFGGERSVVAMMDLTRPNSGIEAVKSLDFVTAKTDQGHVFTLCRCTVHGFAIYATFLIGGDVIQERFSRIDVRYSDISEWFLCRQRVEGAVGEQLNWTTLAEHFSEEIVEGERRFTLSSKYFGSAAQVGEDRILHEYVEFSFKSAEGDFTLEDVRDKTLELGALLSLLIAYPISVISVEVLTLQDKLYSAYFGTFKQLERDNNRDFWMQCFLQKHWLDGRWQLIFRNYYHNSALKKLWIRLAGMLRYEGFWEFNLLGYVSLLDKFVSWRAHALPSVIVPPKPDRLFEFESELSRIAPELGAATTTAMVESAKRIFGQRDLTFAEKYTYSIANTDDNIVKLVDITDEDFRLIKKARDKIAHGEHPGIAEGEFAKIDAVVRKIALLLAYWTLIELGLTQDDFLKALITTRSRLRLGVPLNEKHLDRITGRAAFFSISAEKFQMLSSRKELKVFACFVEGPPGEIELSERYTDILRKLHMNPSRTQQTSWSEIFSVEHGAVRYEGTVYIESGSDTLELSAACIFDKSKLPA